jgi:hypothetical protein
MTMAVLRFTDRWIQSCYAESARDDYADALCPGLHLRRGRYPVSQLSAGEPGKAAINACL